MVLVAQKELIEMLREVVQQELAHIPTKTNLSSENEIDPALTIKKASQVSGYKPATLYSYACKGLIPTFKNKGKLFILRSELYKFMGKPL